MLIKTNIGQFSTSFMTSWKKRETIYFVGIFIETAIVFLSIDEFYHCEYDIDIQYRMFPECISNLVYYETNQFSMILFIDTIYYSLQKWIFGIQREEIMLSFAISHDTFIIFFYIVMMKIQQWNGILHSWHVQFRSHIL